MSRKLVAVIFALSAGCAATKSQQVAKQDAQYSTPGQPKPKGVMRCSMERDTGSNFAERVCTYDDGRSDSTDPTIDETMRRAQQRAAQHVNDAGQSPEKPSARP